MDAYCYTSTSKTEQQASEKRKERVLDFVYEVEKRLTYNSDIPLSYIYNDTVELRNRLSVGGSGEVYEEDCMLLDLVLDILENYAEILDITQNKGGIK